MATCVSRFGRFPQLMYTGRDSPVTDSEGFLSLGSAFILQDLVHLPGGSFTDSSGGCLSSSFTCLGSIQMFAALYIRFCCGCRHTPWKVRLKRAYCLYGSPIPITQLFVTSKSRACRRTKAHFSALSTRDAVVRCRSDESRERLDEQLFHGCERLA